MKICISTVNIIMLVLMTLSMLFGCTLEAAGTTQTSREVIHSRVARMIDEELENVLPYLEEEIELPVTRDVLSSYSGEEIVSRALAEEGGEEYIMFSYELMSATDSKSVLSAAKDLIPEEEYKLLEEKVREEEEKARTLYEETSRKLNMSTAQQKAFYKDLKKMVVKSVVLLTAAVVYAFIPHVVVWGKVTAACAVAVGAGVLASAIMTFLEYKQFDTTLPSFDEWILTLKDDAYAAWALAASVIATSAAAKRSAVVTGLILAAFAVYHVMEDMSKIAKTYNLTI